ncbi:MAG TPA: phospho-N-acetylmuramoyl-pentapeptide-transferase [Candidatus Coprenecus stercoravium]|uniref:Phospho-N-acetylmuramoyl-pentapeptide-transferase n=1 Tax=Candidatus Coprenecus stercoravium TaxID=2840735 RepID=A0A9D2GRG9_9BACT|nr:phospho-N-acetylmuramoyl-pentapeptide-transferase [Candidatus Coprenecus stercoravium]
MIYHIFEHFQYIDFPGSGIMQYISVRSILASITAIVLIMCFGKKFIKYMQRKQLGEEIRDLGLEGQLAKKGTPTMGGVIILGAILISVLLFGDLTNMYIQLLLITLVWLGGLGFVDDYIKVFRKDKEGMPGKYKILGQVILGLAVGITICVHADTDTISTLTTIPFIKNNEFDYAWLAIGSGKTKELLQVVIYVLVIIFIITAVSNGTNLTDGMDGLAAGVTAIVGAALGVLAYFSGNTIYADYLNIMYIPDSGEIVVYMSALVGALLGFLWYNSYPAQIFMGDTGSLALGGIIGVVAVLIRKELLLPILCGIFFAESLSVILQRVYFKYTKKKYGEGRRIFKMSPLHHHFQKEGVPALIRKPVRAIPEAKIVMRFWLVSIILAILTIITLKIR